MMTNIIINRFAAVLFLLGCINLQAQTGIETILTEIEKNNTTLMAYRKQVEAGQLENRTGIYPHNPEFGYAYQYGDPVAIGIKKNINLMQSFDFPTVYANMNRISLAQNQQLETAFQSQRTSILLEAYITCNEIIYTNMASREMGKRLSHASELAVAYEKMITAGEVSLIEYNKVRLNLAMMQQQAERANIEREKQLGVLRRLNGDKPIDLPMGQFDLWVIPTDFDLWIHEIAAINPKLQWIRQEIEINRQQQRLARAKSLPGFSAGYVSEALTHEQFRGWAVGISIPLWENKNRIKLARAQTLAMEGTLADEQLQFESHFRSIHQQALQLQESANSLRANIIASDNATLLERAWQSGEINLLEYLLELSFLYQATDLLMETEKDLAMSLAILKQYEL